MSNNPTQPLTPNQKETTMSNSDNPTQPPTPNQKETTMSSNPTNKPKGETMKTQLLSSLIETLKLNRTEDIIDGMDRQALLRSVVSEKARISSGTKTTAEEHLRRIQKKFNRSEAKKLEGYKVALEAFGARFGYLGSTEKLQARQEELCNAIAVSASNNEPSFLLRRELRYLESTKDNIAIVESFNKINILSTFKSLQKEFAHLQSLHMEGGWLKEVAETRFDDLAAKAEAFVEETLYMSHVWQLHKKLHPESEDFSFIAIIHELNVAFDSMQEWVASAIEFGLHTTWKAVEGLNTMSIFRYDKVDICKAMEVFGPAITSTAKSAVAEKILERISQCAMLEVEFTSHEFSTGDEKLPELLGVDHDFFDSGLTFDLTYNIEEVEKAKEAFEAVLAKEELQQLLKLTNWKIAGGSYKEVMALSLGLTRKGALKASVERTFSPLSLVGRYAKNLMIKVDSKVMSEDEIGMISEATAETLGLAMLTSAGGGRTFLTKGALYAFANISNSLVNVKAYIASLAGSACREEWRCEAMLGVKIFVLYRNGEPVKHADGRVVSYLNKNEGSGYVQESPEEMEGLCKQFRMVHQKWATEYLPKVNAAQQQQIIRDDAWQKAVKSWYSSALMFSERIGQRENYPLSRWKSIGDKPVTCQFNDNYQSFPFAPCNGKEVFHPTNRTAGLTYSARGKKILVLPRLTAEAVACMPLSLRNALNVEESFLKAEASRVDSANDLKINKLKLFFDKADTVGFTPTMIRDIEIFNKDGDICKLHATMKQYDLPGYPYFPSVEKVMMENKPESFQLQLELPHHLAVSVWEILMVTHELYSRKSRSATMLAAFPEGRNACDFALHCLTSKSGEDEEVQFVRSAFSPSLLSILKAKRKANPWAINFDIRKDKGKNKFVNSKASAGSGSSWIAENFTSILIGGKPFHQWKAESEDQVVYPVFEGLDSVFGFDAPGGCKTSFLGKGMLAPINMETFTHIDGITPESIEGRAVEKHPKVGVNPFDGADKTEYKGLLKKKAMEVLEKSFHLLDIECPEDKKVIDDHRNEGKFKIHSYYLGDPMDVAVMVMRQLSKGQTQCTFQATEKMLTGMYREEESGSFINATKESTDAYLAYLGKYFIGGTYLRNELPKIPNVKMSQFQKDLSDRGVDFSIKEIESKKLSASLKYIDELNSTCRNVVVVSNDLTILTGHLSWYANTNVECLVVDMPFAELKSFVEGLTYSYYNTKPSVADLMEEATKVFAELPSVDGEGNDCSDFMVKTNIDNEGHPLHNFVNMMGALCKITAPGLIAKIVESVKSGSDAEIAAATVAMGGSIQGSAILSNKIAESIDTKLSGYVRGAVIKGMNLVAQVYDDLPDDTVMLPAELKVLGLRKETLALIWRYPIASSTSVDKIKVVYSDDPKYRSNLERYGFNLKKFPMAILLPSALKKSFQYDDDGDYFGCLQEPSWSKKSWQLLIARAKNEKDAFANGDYSSSVNLMKLWKKFQSWVMVSGIHLTRKDYQPQNIEMADVVTKDNKKAMKIINEAGKITNQFQKWSHRDGRGPVGMISGLFTVLIGSGLQGDEFEVLAAACSYIQQHSIDSAKYEKLVICAAILLNSFLWTRVDGKLELFHWVNDIVMRWNDYWTDHESNLVKIKALEDIAANLLFEALDGKVELEDCYWLPSTETVQEAAYEDNRLVYFAPSTLLAKMAKTSPSAGSYQKYVLFGKEVPVHPDFADAVDPTRYMAKHCLELCDIKSPVTGKCVGWNRVARFRKIRLRDYVEMGIVSEENKKGKREYFVSWPELPDENGFSSYWNDEENGFAGIISQSIPNSIFKPVLRWAIELVLKGKAGVQVKRNLFLNDEGNVVNIPVSNKPDFSMPWTIQSSDKLMEDFATDKLACRLFNTTMHENGIVECIFPRDYELTDKVIWGFIAWADITLTSELKLHAAQGIELKGSTLKDQYIELGEKVKTITLAEMVEEELALAEDKAINASAAAQQIFLRRIRAYVLRCLVVKLSLWAYCEVSPRMYDRVKTVREAIKTATGATLIQLKSELKELTKYSYDGKLFVHNPSRLQLKFEGKVNALFEDQITDFGRIERRYTLPFGAGYNWLKMPFWYSGTQKEWKDCVNAILNDMFVTGLVRELGFSTCNYNENLKEELKVVDVYEDKDAAVKVIDNSKLVAFLQQANSMHVHMREDDCTIYNCESCMKTVRNFVTTQSRSAKFVRGTKEYKEYKISESAALMAKTAIESIEAQCKTVVSKALADDSFFDNNPYNISRKTAMEYIRIKGSDATKVRYGLSTSSEKETFDAWSKLWRQLPKSKYIAAVEGINFTEWFSLPVPYLIDIGEEMIEVMEQAEGEEDPLSNFRPDCLKVWLSNKDSNAK